MDRQTFDLHWYGALNAKITLATFDLNNLHMGHFVECRQGRYCSAKVTEQYLAYNFDLQFRPPKRDF